MGIARPKGRLRTCPLSFYLYMRNDLLEQTYVIIINWNLAADTIECIDSLIAAGFFPEHIIVVDNGSSDNSVALFRKTYGDTIHILESSTNLGFSGGNNFALRYALGLEANWILFVNNDTVVATSFFEELNYAVTEQPDWSLISPLILYYQTNGCQRNFLGSPSGVIWSLGDVRVWGTFVTRGLLRNQTVPQEVRPYIEVDFLTACCLLVRVDVFKQIGMFDLDYFMYGEDVDFCWRAKQAGFRLGCATRARMWHKVSRSTGLNHPVSRYWRTSNQIRFYRRYAIGLQKLVVFCFTLVQLGKTMLGDVVAGRFGIALVVLRSWFDGWFRLQIPNGLKPEK